MTLPFEHYFLLLEKYGNPVKYWPQWCAGSKTEQTRQVIALGAILVQRTSWHNAQLALENLKKANLLSLPKIANLKNDRRLTKLIRPAGFWQTKPQRLIDFSRLAINKYGSLSCVRNC